MTAKTLVDTPGFLGGSIYVKWPHLKEAIVSAVSDSSGMYTLKPGQAPVHTKFNKQHTAAWCESVAGIHNSLLSSHGVQIVGQGPKGIGKRIPVGPDDRKVISSVR